MAGFEISNIAPTLALLKTMPRQFNADVRKTVTRQVAGPAAKRIAAAGAASEKQSAAAAKTVKAAFDRVPTIRAAGSRRVTKHATGGDIFFGAEFGGRGRKTTMQFRPHRGRTGYWFYPTMRGMSEQISREWEASIDGVFHAWGRG